VDPKGGVYAQQARVIAAKLERRAPDVFREIDTHWKLEQGNGGKKYRLDRMKYLGEDPVYKEEAAGGAKATERSVWE
jgi:hypothetical protein